MSGAQFLLIAAAVAVALAALLWLRSRRDGGPMVVQTRAMPAVKGSFDPGRGRPVGIALGREILPLLEQGRTEEAVALVRAQTGWGEAEARASVTKLKGLYKRLGM